MTESNSFNFNNIVSYTYTETSITFIDKDGETITGTLDTSKNITVGEQIIGQLAENGNLIPAGQTAENTDFLHCKNGRFVNMGTADIQSLVYTYDNETGIGNITYTDSNGIEYEFGLGEGSDGALSVLDFDDKQRGIFNPNILFTQVGSRSGNTTSLFLIDVGNNTYWDEETLQEHLKEIGIDSISYDIESENKTITITDDANNEYTMTLTQVNGQWKLPGDLGTLYPTTKTLILGSGESMQNINFGTSMIDVGNNTYWDEEALQKQLPQYHIILQVIQGQLP